MSASKIFSASSDDSIWVVFMVRGLLLFHSRKYLLWRCTAREFRELAVVIGRASLREMSRRSRKKSAAGKQRWLGKAVVSLLVLAVLGLGAGYGLLRYYLHSDAFRRFLSAEAGEVAGVTGEFSPFDWHGLAVDTEAFEAHGVGPITGLRADGLHTEVGLGGVRRGVWEILDSNVRRLEVSVDTTKQSDDRPPKRINQGAASKMKLAGWFPKDAELQGIDVRELVVKAILKEGLVTANGMSVRAEPAGAKGAYRAEIKGGVVRLPFAMVPEMQLDHVRLRYQDERVFLTEATIVAWDSGRIQGAGEWDMASRQFFMEGDLTGAKCENILNSDWSRRLTGGVTSSFVVNNRQGFPQADGKITIQNGVLTALPMLDALAAYADTRRFRVLTLNEAHTEWHWKKGELTLTNLVLASEGLVRIEGGMTIRGQEMDGVFRLGLAPGTLSTIPGAETDVFAPGEHGLLWTTLRITGTLDDPKEDLTNRLITAAGLRMFEQLPETGEQAFKFTRSLLGSSSPKAIENGDKIIKETRKTVREISGILDGILRTKSEDSDKEDEQQ